MALHSGRQPQVADLHLGRELHSTISHGVTLGWLGSSVAVYADDDPVWKELAKLPPEKLEKAFPDYVGRLPIAVRADVSNGLRLAAFLVAARAFVEQTGREWCFGSR